MCTICDQARKLPKHKALALIANAMASKNTSPCLDKTIGDIVDEPDPIVDRYAEGAWESRRRGR
jgi:hypothetical protein